jgi:hypothetical protein
LERFSAGIMVDRLESLYRSLAAQRAR